MAFLDLASVMPPGRVPAGGERLAGHPAIVKFELLCDGKPAYFLGAEQRAEATEPNWRQALEFGLELINSSADIGVLIRLSSACLRQKTLADFVDCIVLIAELLDSYWTECYPELEQDDGGGAPDASVRLGVLGRLDDEKLILGRLRDCALSRDESGALHTSIQSLLTSGSDNDAGDRREALTTAIKNLERASEAANRIETLVRAKSPADADFSVHRFVATCADLHKQLAGALNNTEVEGGGGPSSDATINGFAELKASTDPIRGREQAIQQIRQIVRYFETAEPSSPVIGVLNRAIELVGKDFWGIISELGEQRLMDAVSESRLFNRR